MKYQTFQITTLKKYSKINQVISDNISKEILLIVNKREI